jgi:thioredoxin 1
MANMANLANVANDGRVIEVDDATFEAEVLGSETPVLVDFGAPWCAPCKALAAVVHRVAAEQAGRVKVVAVDTDASPRTAERYGVRAVPTLMVFRNGEKVTQHLGATTREKVLALLGA